MHRDNSRNAAVIPRNEHPFPDPGNHHVEDSEEKSRVLRLYPALANHDFRLFWIGMLPAMIAFQMNMVAAPYAAFTLAGNATVLGLISLALGIPMMVLALAGGVVADRFPRRGVIIATQTLLFSVAAILAGLTLSGRLEVWHILALSFLQGTAFSFNMPARQAYVAELVGHSLLRSAVTLNNAGMNFTRIAGPALAGMLISIPFVGIGGVFVVMAAMYVLVLASLFRLPEDTPAPDAHRKAGGWEQMLEGLRYVRSSPALLALLVMALAATLLGMSFQTLMPVFAESIFQAGPGGLGALTAATGIGAFAGSLLVASRSRDARPAVLQAAFGIGFGMALVVFALSPSLTIAIGVLIAIGFLSAAFAALNNTLVMTNTAPNLYGRVMSIYMLTFGAMPLGAMPLAWLADHTGARFAVALSGVLVAIAIAAVVVLYPAYKRIK